MIERSTEMPPQLAAVFAGQIDRCTSTVELRELLITIARLPAAPSSLVALCADRLIALAVVEHRARRGVEGGN